MITWDQSKIITNNHKERLKNTEEFEMVDTMKFK